MPAASWVHSKGELGLGDGGLYSVHFTGHFQGANENAVRLPASLP